MDQEIEERNEMNYMDRTLNCVVLQVSFLACVQYASDFIMSTWKELQEWSTSNDVDLETCKVVSRLCPRIISSSPNDH